MLHTEILEISDILDDVKQNVTVSKLTMNDIVNDRWTYDHSTSPLTVTNQQELEQQ
jgi:hypothetical protein